MSTVAISIREEDRHFLEELVRAGHYLSESDVIAQALEDFRVRQAERQNAFAELRAKIQIGIAQADAGEFVEFSAGDVKREGREWLARRESISR